MLNPIFYFIGMALALAFAHSIAISIPFFRQALSSPATRHRPFEGLRGFLALSVFFHHAYTSLSYWGGKGVPTHSSFYFSVGKIPVALFFALTGYFFWVRLCETDRVVEWKAFYAKRFWRLAPAYYLSVGILLLFVAWRSNFTLRVPPGRLFAEILPWIAFGFPTLAHPGINLVPRQILPAGVYWTLMHEWAFLLCLPFFRFFTRGHRVLLLIIGASLLCVLGRRYFATELRVPAVNSFFIFVGNVSWAFGIGIFCAYLRRRNPAVNLSHSRFASVVILVSTAALFFIDLHSGALSFVVQRTLLTLVFYLIVAGNTVFGALKSRPFRMMGMVSYSFYLLHCTVLAGFAGLYRLAWPTQQLSTGTFWGIMGATLFVSVIVSALSFRFVELPFLSPAKGETESAPARIPERLAA